MPVYMLHLDPHHYRDLIMDRFRAAWSGRSFVPLASLADALKPSLAAYCERYRIGPEQFLLTALDPEWSFDRHIWTELLGETLVVSATDIPLPPPGGDSLLDQVRPWPDALSIVDRAMHGSRSIEVGTKCYRPENAGWSDSDDVARIAESLARGKVEPWLATTASDGDEDAQEERELALQYLAFLEETYRIAGLRGSIMVLEWD